MKLLVVSPITEHSGELDSPRIQEREYKLDLGKFKD